jgi:hypothetical protein
MKKIIVFVVICLSSISLFAQTDTTVKKDAPEIVFDKMVYDFGTIPYASNGTFEFNFKNTGKEPLVIKDVQKQCGCTGVDWTKEPVKKNKSGVVKVTYNTKIAGPFQKNVTVYSNAKTATVVLTFKGTVEAEVVKEATTAPAPK